MINEEAKEKAKKERAKRIRNFKKKSDYEIAECITNSWIMNMDRAAEVICRVRSQIRKGDEWANMMRWHIEPGEVECESWASICSQAYGYSYKYHYILDTGFNKYETTVFDCEGWYTE